MYKSLSIIIPTYNMEKYLRKCLESLIVSDENMGLLEVLVINDGSKDFSSQIAHEFENKYPQTFRVIDKENGNYGSCVNRGLKEATGKYVKVLDADDTFNNAVFDKFVSYLNIQDVDLVISDFDIVDEKGYVIKSVKYKLPENRTFSLSRLSKKDSPYLWHHSITYKLELFDKFVYKQTEGISYSDEEWVFKPMVAVHNVSYFHETLYLYLRGREGQTYDPNVLKRTRSHKDIMVNSLVVFYENYKEAISDSGAARFMYDRVIMILSNMYRYYFFDQRTEEGQSIITNYDKELEQKCNYLFNEMGHYLFKKKVNFYYVDRWRKSNYNDQALIFTLYRFLYRCIKVIRK